MPELPPARRWEVPARSRRALPFLLAAVAAGPALRAQATVIPVTSATHAALENAVRAANARAFQSSAASPVVIEFASGLIGQTIPLARALPPLVVDHVTLRVAGAGPTSRVTIDAAATTTALRFSSRFARFENLRFVNAGGPGSQEDLVTGTGADDLAFANCDFEGATGNALWLLGCIRVTVQDCAFRRSVAALVATAGTADLLVARCTFTDNTFAALLASSYRIQIRDCTMDRNATGVALAPICQDVTFGPANVVRNATAHNGLHATGTVRLLVQGNLFVDQPRAAIQLLDLCSQVSIEDNVLQRNGAATGDAQVAIQDCVGVQLRGNLITGGGAGVTVDATRQFGIVPSAAGQTTISANAHEGLVLRDCAGAYVERLVLNGNLAGAGGVQLQVFRCADVDVVGTSVAGATGAQRIGVRIAESQRVHFGHGSTVHDHGGQGVIVGDSTDVVLGNWTPGAGSLDVRGPNPLAVTAGAAVRVVGEAAAPCQLRATAVATPIAVFVSGQSRSGALGPFVTVDGGGVTNVAVQLADCGGWLLDGVTIRGHGGFGLVAVRAPDLLVRGCVVDGANAASGEGMLLSPACDRARLFGNLVQRQQGSAFVVRESDGVLLGPGNRALDNGGDGFAIWDVGSGAPVRRTTVQSCVAVGRGAAGQNGFRCVNVRATLVNVTATRNGAGVMLNLGAQATLVNCISWGNGFDRDRDPPSAGTWLHCLRGSSRGSGGPGSWSDQNVLNADPRFVAAASGDVRLQAGSPAIDSGLHATPAGAPLPCADADLQPRIRGGVVDRGALESVPSGGSGNTLDVVGPWLRPLAASQLTFVVQRTPAQAGQLFVLIGSGSGTGPGIAAPGGSTVPLVADVFTSLLLSAPRFCVGILDGTGRGTVSLPLPPSLALFLPELTCAAGFAGGGPSTNPVIVRFLP